MYGEPHIHKNAHIHSLRTYALRSGSVVHQSTPDNELVNTYILYHLPPPQRSIYPNQSATDIVKIGRLAQIFTILFKFSVFAEF